MRRRLWLGIALLLAGVCIFLYPQFQQMRQDAEQQRLLDSLAESGSEAAAGGNLQDRSGDTNPADLKPEPQQPARQQPKVQRQRTQQPETPQPAEELAAPQTFEEGQAIGVIEIPKIESRLPIVEGISNKSLKAGAGHFPGTAMPGRAGNTAIAAHRSYKYGKMFNRLDELKKGDTIIITLKQEKETFTYKVTDKFVVKPTQVSVLKQPKQGKYLTLVTCTPIRVATHRLIVRAEAVS